MYPPPHLQTHSADDRVAHLQNELDELRATIDINIDDEVNRRVAEVEWARKHAEDKAAYLQHELDELRTATDENLADEVTRRVADADSGR